MMEFFRRIRGMLSSVKEMTERCTSCNQPVRVVWRSTDEEWRAVTGSEEGVLCVHCFDREAMVRFHVLLRWTPLVFYAVHRCPYCRSPWVSGTDPVRCSPCGRTFSRAEAVKAAGAMEKAS